MRAQGSLGVDTTALAAVCERLGVAELAVFGSVVTGAATRSSDIDVLYVMKPGVQLGWRVNQLADELERVLGRPVDLVAKKSLHARLADFVLAQAQVVYAA